MLDSYKVPSMDVTWVFVGPSTWTAVEVNIGIVSGRSNYHNIRLYSLGLLITYSLSTIISTFAHGFKAHSWEASLSAIQREPRKRICGDPSWVLGAAALVHTGI